VSDWVIMRVLYSFPHPLGAPGIGSTAWHQVDGLQRLGQDVMVSTTSVARGVSGDAQVQTTLAAGRARLPHRALGLGRALALHDWRTARALERQRTRPDIVHVWPGATLHTASAARRLGIPVVRECPNTHTAHALAVAQRAAVELNVALPVWNSHRDSPGRVEREALEYSAADFLLVPSTKVLATFTDRDIDPSRLLQHQYGFDPRRAPLSMPQRPREPVTFAFVGAGEPRKGLHLALRAWHATTAASEAKLVIAGRIMPEMVKSLSPLLDHHSVELLGFREDVGEVLGRSHVLVLPSLEEGSALVTYEAQGWGCALLVSDASGARCRHDESGLLHPAGDGRALATDMERLVRDADCLGRLCRGAWQAREGLTWDRAAQVLLDQYKIATGASAST
jgi:glycosyltransferase involved in cell wall biosynthesis